MSLQQLPNELLFNTAGHLSKGDLCRLSLVSQRLAAIAQVQLHLHPKIGSGDRSLFRFLCLDVTLQKRPDLAAVVRTLELEPAVKSRYEEVRSDGEAYRQRETDFVGSILHRAINLQRLDLTLLVDVGSGNVVSHDPRKYIPKEIGFLFHQTRSGKLDLQTDLSLVPGLKTLQALSMSSRSIEWAWCILPGLKMLHIGQHSVLTGCLGRSEQSQVEELHFDRHTRLLREPELTPITFYHFLGGFPKLVKLVVTLCNTVLNGAILRDFYPFISPHNPGSFECLIGIINPVASTLEHLVIKECDHRNCSSIRNFVSPVKSLAQFKRLKTLDVPYEALFDAQHRPAATILPDKLEKLILSKPQSTIFPVLEDLATRPEDLPSLKWIEIYLDNARGLECEDVIYTPRKIWRKLRARDLWCKFWFLDGDVREDWEDKDYDPFICVIVSFLESL